MRSEEIAKYLSSGGEIKRLKPGFAIGYVPVDCSTDISDVADDAMNVMICTYSGGYFLDKREKAKGIKNEG
jgi:hypothetical protein